MPRVIKSKLEPKTHTIKTGRILRDSSAQETPTYVRRIIRIIPVESTPKPKGYVYVPKNKPFTAETMEFRNLNRDDKFESVYALCQELGRMPRTYTSKKIQPTQYERVRAQFIVNMISARNRGELGKHDMEMLTKLESQLESYRKHIKVSDKITAVYEFYVKNNRLPNESDGIYFHWNRIKFIAPANVPSDFRENLRTLQAAKKPIQKKTRIERLNEILTFCESSGRSPKQHSGNEIEQNLANFISTTSQRLKNNTLTADEIVLYNKIRTFIRSR